MSIIGVFTKTASGFEGTVKTLMLNTKARLVPAEGGADNAPDYRIFSGPIEIGAGWKRTSEQNRDYVSVKLDEPMLANPIYCNLFATDDLDSFHLVWTRQRSN